MNIAICDDNAPDAAALRSILNGFMEQNAYTGKIFVFRSGEELLASFSLGLYGVIFLDIYMGGVNGIETARRIRAADPVCVIIFITSSSDHSLESYSVRGSAYVVKPIRAKEMQTALYQCREAFMKNARYIEIRTDRMDMKIPLIKILYIESNANYAVFHTFDGEYTTRMTLDEIERQLGGKPFYRCHQSFIINTNHIRKLEQQEIIMKRGKSVPMRTHGRDGTRAELADILSSRMFEV